MLNLNNFRRYGILFILSLILLPLTSSLSIDFPSSSSTSTNVYIINDTELNHNNISGLQGGTTDEYYHFTEGQHTSILSGITNWITNTVSDLVNYYNKTESDDRYLQTESDPLAYNGTLAYNSSLSNYYLNSNPFSYYNVTTAPIYINDTFAGNYSDYLTLFNWNKTYADTLYSPISEPLSLHLNQDNWLNDSNNWIYWTTADDRINFNESKLSTIYYNATSATLIHGTIDGTIDLTQHPDGAYDSVTLNITEVAGSPGLDVRINFTDGIESFSQGIMRYYTNSLAGSYPIIQLWDYNAGTWTDYPYLVESLSFRVIEQSVFNSDRYVQDGTVQMRLYKDGNGNTNNHYYIDWLAIAKGYGIPSGEEVDPIWESEKVNYYNTTQINTSYIPYTGANKNVDLGANNFTVGTDSFFVDASSGNVGIGTTTPGAKLQVQSGNMGLLVGADGNAETLTDATSKFMRFGMPHYTNAEEPVGLMIASSTSSSSYMTLGGGSGSFNAVEEIRFNTAVTDTTTTGTERMRIDKNGNVGIGTTAPAQKLDVHGVVAIGDGSQSVVIRENINRGEIIGISPNLGAYNPLLLQASNSNQLYLNTNGNVGIGTTSPGAKLEIAKSGSNTPGTNNSLYISTDAGTDMFGLRLSSSNSYLSFDNNFAGWSSAMVIMRDGGNVGIGTASPTAVLNLKAGTATASTAPLKFTSGTLLTTPEDGTIEYLSNNFYIRGSDGLSVAGNINTESAYLYDGYNAIKLATKGDTLDYTSTIIGRLAGDSVVDGTTTRQTAIGYAAGHSNTGTHQTALGYYAGQSNTGNYQTALGMYAGRENSGTSQTALGYLAGYSNTGSYQTALGMYAGASNTGNYQTALGYLAGRYNSGNTNTAIGYDAFNAFPLDTANAEDVDSVDAGNNRVTITGHSFGATDAIVLLKASTTGALPAGLSTAPHQWKVIDANTLECETDSFTDAGTGTHTLTPQFVYSNSVALGYNAEPDASNQIVLGDASVTQLKTAANLYISGTGDNYINGNVGIGTTSPGYKLTVGNESNTNASLISAYFEGNVTAAGFITRTSVYDKESGEALDKIKDSSYYLNPDKTINHSKFYGYTSWEVNDTSRPVYENYTENVCVNVPINTTVQSCNQEPITEEYTYTTQECGYQRDGLFYYYICEDIQNQGIRNKQECHNETKYRYEQPLITNEVCSEYFNEETNLTETQCHNETTQADYYEQVEYQEQTCNDVYQEVCKDEIVESSEQSCSDEIRTKTTYPYLKTVEGVNLEYEINTLRQGMSEYIETIKPVKLEDNLTAVNGTVAIFENYLTNTPKDTKNKEEKKAELDNLMLDKDSLRDSEGKLIKIPEIAKSKTTKASWSLSGLLDWVYEMVINHEDRIRVLENENALIKGELCKKDNSYAWCLK